MTPVTYICERYPGLSIGSTIQREVKFRRGRFVATEKWQTEIIESNAWFDVFIFKAEPHTVEPVVEAPAPIQKAVKPGTGAAWEAPEPVAKATPEPPPPPEDSPFEAPAKPVYKASESAIKILEEKGISLREAGEMLGLSDGDRVTVKMADEIGVEDE
jgi:hypothetical protein